MGFLSGMKRIEALFTAAFAILGAPGLALAQSEPQRAGSGAWVLPVIFGTLAVAIIWFTRKQRRQENSSKKIP